MENYAVGGISIMLIILGIVQWAKETFNLSGNPVKVLSMVLGVVFGILYQLTINPNTSPADWFFIGLFGFGMGLAASGLYSVAAKTKATTTINTQNVSLPAFPEDLIVQDGSQDKPGL